MPGLVRVFYPFLMLETQQFFLVSTLEYRGRREKKKKRKYPARNLHLKAR